MKRKHIIATIIFIFLLFMTSMGAYLEEFARQGASFESMGRQSLVLALANLFIASIIMMLVPLSCRLINRKRLSLKRGNRLCLWNSIILFVLNIILLAISDISFIGGVGALFFYFINKWSFVEYRQDFNVNELSAEQITTKINNVTVPNISNTAPHTTISETPVPVTKPYNKYCSRCGNGIDPITKKCTGCGKQYFKGITIKGLLIVTLSVLFTVSFAGNIILSYAISSSKEEYDEFKNSNKTRIAALKSEISELEERYKTLKNKYYEANEKATFMDKHVVFVEDDGTKLYHKYDCIKFSKNSFWAFNVEATKNAGYKPCPICCE